MNPEHREGSQEQAIAYFNEQLDGKTAEVYADLLRSMYNFVMAGAHGKALHAEPMKNGKTLYLIGEIR